MLLTSVPSAAQLGPRNKPVALARVHPELARRANGVFPFDGSMRDALLGAVTLSFGSGTAAPSWGVRPGGYGLVFDGSSDLASGTLQVAPAAYGMWVASGISFDVVPAAAADAFALTHAIASGAFLRIGCDASGNLRGVVRTVTAGTVGTVTGPAIEQGKVYNCVFISRTRTEHVLYINGARFLATTDIGATFTAGLETIAAGALVLNTNSLFFDGCAHWGVYGTKDPGDGFLQALSINPYKFLFAPAPRIWIPITPGAIPLTIADTAHAQTAGSLTLTQAHALAIANEQTNQYAGAVRGVDLVDVSGSKYLSHSVTPYGIPSSSKGTVSFLVRLDASGDYVGIIAGNTSGFDVSVGYNGDGKVHVAAVGASGNLLINGASALSVGTVHHVIATWDADIGQAKIFVDDVDDTSGTPTVQTGPYDYDSTSISIGESDDGAVGEVFFMPGEYIGSVVANRRKFVTQYLRPVYLGEDGSLPFGSAPPIYVHLGTGENPANFGINRGTLDDFFVVGTLTSVTFRNYDPGFPLDLTQVHMLALANALHGQSAGNIALMQAHILVLVNLLHSQSADNITLSAAAELVLSNLLHSQSAGSLALTQAHVLALANELHAQTAGTPTLTQAHVLALANAAHAQLLDNLTLTQAHILALANALHGQTANNLTLSGASELVLASLVHSQTEGNLVLVQVHALALANLLHGQSAGNLALTQAHGLLLSNLLHGQAAAGVVMTQAHAITIANMLHANLVDSMVLDFSVVLSIGNSVHGHLADSLGLSQGHVIAISDAVHAHLADNLNLSQAQFLVVSDALHAHLINNITFGDLIAISPDALLTVEGEDRILVMEAANRLLVVMPQRFTKKVLH